MSRYSKKCLVSNDDLLGFFGEKYDALLKQASFLSLIGGNTLQFDPTLDERFDLVCYDDKINMIFDKDKRLKFFIVGCPLDEKLVSILSTEDIPLTEKMDLASIKSVLGEPVKSVGSRKLPGLVKNGSMLEKKVPVLGVVGTWDKYKSVSGHTIQVLYEVGSTKVKSVFYR